MWSTDKVIHIITVWLKINSQFTKVIERQYMIEYIKELNSLLDRLVLLEEEIWSTLEIHGGMTWMNADKLSFLHTQTMKILFIQTEIFYPSKFKSWVYTNQQPENELYTLTTPCTCKSHWVWLTLTILWTQTYNCG